MKDLKQIIGKILYAMAFIVLLPFFLWYWADAIKLHISLPGTGSTSVGIGLMVFGGLLMIWGMLALIIWGKGLPMNAYPPPVLVTRGPYRIFHHPIYCGFACAMLGYFLFAGSSSGVWIVSPLTILGMVALVMGYESIDIKRRISADPIQTILDLPPDSDEKASRQEKVVTLFWVGLCWLLTGFVMNAITNIPGLAGGEAHTGNLLLTWPTSSIVAGIYIVVGMVLMKKKMYLRRWAVTAFIALGISVFLSFISPRFGIPVLLQKGLNLQVPLFMVLITGYMLYFESKKYIGIHILLLSLIAFILLNSSKSSIHYLGYSFLIFLLSVSYLKFWNLLRQGAEKIANSWQEWIFGKIRIINHGIYVGLGAFIGIMIAGTLSGKTYAMGLLVFTIIVTICSALWAQIVEGSAKLKRPFGYYGGVVGILFGSIAMWLMGLNIWIILGVLSVVMPWVQAIGRLRCLVNGCCHGSRMDNPLVGIRYYHERSRVCTISGLKGELLHPTPLYAILWLVLVGFILLKMWLLGISPSFIFGLYLILTGLGRFVEEAYRGEVQTPNVRGLHLYQWTAIVTVFLGIGMTMIQTEFVLVYPGFSLTSLWISFVCGLFIFFTMGVDFPGSNARFSRLV